ncbi:hypothetical protein N7G274_000402 [Stereocaulon virgatum]|uniref:ANK_REP_REGION domain-containing protein n=1 Tax=Stereocaulon virgatum TaxID=373712 RepID=A0ABR4ASQ3_9LECA
MTVRFFRLDISILTAQFRTFMTELLNTQQDHLHHDPPGYVIIHPGTMQTITLTRQEVDLEAQSRGENEIAQRTFVSKVKVSLDYKPMDPCKRACSCACHGVYRLKSPSVLQNVIGSLLVKSNGLYGLSQPCNEFSYRRNFSASIRLSYHFPEWLLNLMVSSIVISNQLTSPHLSLVAPRIVAYKFKIIDSAFAGSVDGITRLFELRLASSCDLSDDYGCTPFHYVVDKGHMYLCRFLLKAEARPDITDLDDNSVIDFACDNIISKKVSPDETAELDEMFNKDGWFEERQFSVLHKIHLDLLPTPRDLDQELSASTKNINLGDSEGRTPLSWAAEHGNVQALEILLC